MVTTQPNLVLADYSRKDPETIHNLLHQYSDRLDVTVTRRYEETIEHLKTIADRPQFLLLVQERGLRDCIDTVEELQAKRLLTCMPVVFLAENGDKETVRLAYAAGANSVVERPTASDRLQEVMNRLLSYWLSVNTTPHVEARPVRKGDGS